MTIKFLKEWECLPMSQDARDDVQRCLDGGVTIHRCRDVVTICTSAVTRHVFIHDTPAKAVKFAAALNKLRRPVRLLKQDLDADWAERVKARDNDTCVLCGVKGPKKNADPKKNTCDSLNAHHWLKTKARSGMARWARPCGVTVHYAEHIHSLHENPCWVDLDEIHTFIYAREPEGSINATIKLANVVATEARVRKAWFEMKQRQQVLQ